MIRFVNSKYLGICRSCNSGIFRGEAIGIEFLSGGAKRVHCRPCAEAIQARTNQHNERRREAFAHHKRTGEPNAD